MTAAVQLPDDPATLRQLLAQREQCLAEREALIAEQQRIIAQREADLAQVKQEAAARPGLLLEGGQA